MSAEAGLAVHAAVRHYGSVVALDGVDLRVPRGSFCVLLGPSGSGKSTLARAVVGIEQLDAGQIHLNGVLASDGPRGLAPEKRDLAMVFQDYALWPHLSTLGNVRFALRRHRLPSGTATQRALAALDHVGLAGKAGRYPHELSGGEQQRVALARAVVGRPALLVFDEPLSNLDSDLRERMRILVASLARDCGATSLYITHDQGEAFALADLVGVLHRGRLEQLALPEQVYRYPASPFVAAFTGLAGELSVDIADDAAPLADTAPPVAVGTLVAVRGPDCPEGVWGRYAGGSAVVGAARLLLRPTAVRLGPASHRGALAATVIDVAYRGRGYDHVVRLPGGTDLVGVSDPVRHGRGDNVGVFLDPAGSLIFPGASPAIVERNGPRGAAVGRAATSREVPA